MKSAETHASRVLPEKLPLRQIPITSDRRGWPASALSARAAITPSSASRRHIDESPPKRTSGTHAHQNASVRCMKNLAQSFVVPVRVARCRSHQNLPSKRRAGGEGDCDLEATVSKRSTAAPWPLRSCHHCQGGASPLQAGKTRQRSTDVTSLSRLEVSWHPPKW